MINSHMHYRCAMPPRNRGQQESNLRQSGSTTVSSNSTHAKCISQLNSIANKLMSAKRSLSKENYGYTVASSQAVFTFDVVALMVNLRLLIDSHLIGFLVLLSTTTNLNAIVSPI